MLVLEVRSCGSSRELRHFRRISCYKPILQPKLSAATRQVFLSAFLSLCLVSAFHIDGVRNTPVLIK